MSDWYEQELLKENTELKAELAKRDEPCVWVKIDLNDRSTLPDKCVEVLGALLGVVSDRYIKRPITLILTDDGELDFQTEGFRIANCWTLTHWRKMPADPIQIEDKSA